MLTVTFAGQSRRVVISSFIYSIRRYPSWIEYAISCTPLQGPPATQQAPAGTGTADAQVQGDAAQANAVAQQNVGGG